MTTQEISPQVLKQTFNDFKKIVDKYFSSETFVEGVFDSVDMANVLEEMSTVCEKFDRFVKRNKDKGK